MKTLRVPLVRKLAGLRLHGLQSTPHRQSAERVEWLVSLRDLEKRRRADSAALHALAAAATDAIEELPGVVRDRLQEVAGMAVELGLAIAREIVGCVLDEGRFDPTAVVKRCLADCVRGTAGSELVVRLNPEDLPLVEQALAAAGDVQEQLERARLVADRAVPRGAVRAETDAGRLEYDPRDALERVSAEVRREVRG